MSNNTEKKKFVVVKFIVLPFKGIDNYVCVPFAWITRELSRQMVVVAYPNDEDPFLTKDRVKRTANYNEEWKTYIALLKYITNTYPDAARWIAIRNAYEDVIEEDSEIMDGWITALNKKLRKAEQNHSSISIKLPKLSIKRPTETKLEKLINEKRLKVDEAGSESRNNQSMINSGTQKTAAAPSSELDVSYLTKVIDCNEDVQFVSELIASSSQHFSQSAKQPESVQEPDISMVLSSNTTENNQNVCTGDISDNKTSHQILKPQKMFDKMFNQSTQEPIKQKMLLNNIARNLGMASQNRSTQNRKPDTSKMLETYANNSIGQRASRSNMIRSQENQHVHKINIKRSHDMTAVDPKKVLQSNVKVTSTSANQIDECSNNLISVQDSLYQPPQLSQQQQPSPSKICAGIPIKPKSDRQKPTLQGVTKRTISPMTSKVQNLIRQDFLATSSNYQLNGQRQEDKYMVEQSLSPEYKITFDSKSASDHEVVSDPSISVDKASIEKKNNIHYTGISTARKSAGTPINASGNDQKVRTGDVSDNKSSHQILKPQKIFDKMFNQSTQIPIKQNTFLSNSAKNLGIASQNESTENPKPDTSEVPETYANSSIGQRASRSNMIRSQKNQHVHKINIKSSHNMTAVDPTKILQSITNVTSTSANQIDECSNNLISVQHPLYQPPQLSQQQQPSPSKICAGIPIKPKSDRQKLTLQGVTKRTISPMTSKVQNLIRQDLLAISSNYQLNGQRQEDKYMVEQSLSPEYKITFDSKSASDHEVVSDPSISVDKASVEKKNNIHYTGISTARKSAGTPMNVQNLTLINEPMHPRAVLEQKMLDQFAALFSQTGASLHHIYKMHHNLRALILQTAYTYKNLIKTVEKFNATTDLGIATCSCHVASKISRETEERHNVVIEKEDSSIDDQHNDSAVNDTSTMTPTLKEGYNDSWKLFLPPEYDPHDSRWTLKYRNNNSGLVELLPRSGIYVSDAKLRQAERMSNSCKTLVRRLLPEVFSKNALSVCLSMTERSSASNDEDSLLRPSLDVYASMVLFNFVLKCGRERGWDTDTQAILSGIHSKIQKIRFKHCAYVAKQ